MNNTYLSSWYNSPIVRVKAIVIILLGLLAVQASTSMWMKSPTVDEVTFITSGYYMLKTGDFSLNSAHSISLQMLIASPLLGMDLKLPQHTSPFFKTSEYTDLDNWRYAVEFMDQNNINVEQIVFRVRLIVVLLALILGIYIFKWSNELYGVKAGLFALFLYVFSPNILAHSRLATLDIGYTALVFIGIYYYSKLIINPELKYLLLAGVFLGLIFLAKNTALSIIFVYGLYFLLAVTGQTQAWAFLANRTSKKWGDGAISFLVSLFGVLVIAWFVINLGYGFQGVFKPLSSYTPTLARGLFSTDGPLIGRLIGALPVPLPESFTEMLKINLRFVEGGLPSYLMGQWSRTGWWYYHLVAFIIKVPVPIFLFLITTVIMTLRARHDKGFSTAEYILLIPILSIFLVVSLVGVKLGLRHILPILPFLFVFLSRLVTFDFGSRRWLTPLFALLCSWYLISSVSIYPHYLAYFNELVGGPDNGHNYLVDSNLDWGQDLKGLGQYMADNDIAKVKLSYFGSADPSFYGIDYEYLPSLGLRPSEPDGKWWYENGYQEVCEPTSGVIAISTTILQGGLSRNRNCFHWLKSYEPIAKIGYSIFVYEVNP